ncbi:TetR/AcrR family transcriptional regulator [Anaerotignum sp.]|uniref:TetR/AcrR family transcriptional regulator n=1 Tax=Anaerotignum sp. TaxID=2039241 RepID=UPI0027148954|nr:TetR/AcrR family transcriptional regulator [Anaerotignum sp.]
MGASDRKEKEKEIRRNDIIDAAEKVIFSKGYDIATMDDIAKEAEFSKRTVYIYFNSKEQLYFEIMVRGYKILIEKIESYLSNLKDKNALDRIKQMGRTLYDFNNEYPDYFNAIMSYENGEKDFTNGIPDKSREECYALGERLFAYLTSALADGIEEGVVRREIDIVNTAFVLWSCIIGLFKILTKKSNYIQYYHNRNSEAVLLEGLEMLMMMIQI